MQKLASAQQGYAEIMAMSDEIILERARVVEILQQFLTPEEHPNDPDCSKASEGPNLRGPTRSTWAGVYGTCFQETSKLFDLPAQHPPSTYQELVKYITDTLRKGLDRRFLTVGAELGKGEFGSVCEGTIFGWVF
jgi:hypothetical protein